VTFWGHVTSLLTWPLDSQCGVSYKDKKVTGVTSWPYGVIQRYLSHDYWTRTMGFPIGGRFELTVYLTWLFIYWASKILGSWHGPFGGHVMSSITWPLDYGYAVSYRWSFETITLSCIAVEILCVKHTLSQAYSHWKCIDPHFLAAKLGVTVLCNFVLVDAL